MGNRRLRCSRCPSLCCGRCLRLCCGRCLRLCCGRCLRLCCGRCPHRAALLRGLRPSHGPARSAKSRPLGTTGRNSPRRRRPLRPVSPPSRSAPRSPTDSQTGTVGEAPATWEDRPEQSEEEASVAAGVPTEPLCSAVSDRLTDRRDRRSPGHLGRPAGTVRGGGVRCGRCPHRAALLCGLRPAHGPARSAKSRLQTGTVGEVPATWEDRPEQSEEEASVAAGVPTEPLCSAVSDRLADRHGRRSPGHLGRPAGTLGWGGTERREAGLPHVKM